jgi:RNA polymerase sigma factor (sigma-70 family)
VSRLPAQRETSFILADFLLRRVFNCESTMTDSQQLLRDYAQTGSETAFRELVTRYLDLVYSTAFRLVSGDFHLAEDVAQLVFLDLCRQAGTISSAVMLGGWLHRHTCFVAGKVIRGERRRQHRERQAVEMNALNQSDAGLAQLAPVLDEAINELEEEDRKAILLRFYERMDLRSVGMAIGASENAAQKRVTRALDQLQSILTRRGVTASASALGVMVAAEAVTAAPVGLAASLAGDVLVGAGAARTLTALLNMTKLKFGIASAIAIATLATPLVMQRHSLAQLHRENRDLRYQLSQLTSVAQENERLSNLLAKATAQSRDSAQLSELLRLRGEVGRLRNAEAELTRLSREGTKSASTGLGAGAPSTVGPSEQPRFIFVGGEVSTPGRFLWTNGMTLATVIELAHGYTDAANRSVAQIKDANGSSITVNFGESSEPAATKDVIQPGVSVFVPRNDPNDGSNR